MPQLFGILAVQKASGKIPHSCDDFQHGLTFMWYHSRLPNDSFLPIFLGAMCIIAIQSLCRMTARVWGDRGETFRTNQRDHGEERDWTFLVAHSASFPIYIRSFHIQLPVPLDLRKAALFTGNIPLPSAWWAPTHFSKSSPTVVFAVAFSVAPF